MADLTKSVMSRNAGATVTSNNGAGSQTIVYNRSDENIFIRVSNADATTALIRVKANGYGGGDIGDLDVEVAQNAIKTVGPIESYRFKDPATGKITVEVLDTDGTSFGGTVTNVKFEVYEAPKGLVD